MYRIARAILNASETAFTFTAEARYIHNLDITGEAVNELKKIIPAIKDEHTIYDPIGINRTGKDLTIAECDGVRPCEYDYCIDGSIPYSPGVFDPVSGYGCPPEGGYFEDVGCCIRLYLNGEHVFDVTYEGGDPGGTESENIEFFETIYDEIKFD